MVSAMGLPTEAVTLSVPQIEALSKLLSTLRHDVNGDLALVVASAELIKLNPASAPRMLETLLQQPTKIRDRLEKFSAELEKAMQVTRP